MVSGLGSLEGTHLTINITVTLLWRTGTECQQQRLQRAGRLESEACALVLTIRLRGKKGVRVRALALTLCLSGKCCACVFELLGVQLDVVPRVLGEHVTLIVECSATKLWTRG
jgi:hypothetical protein